MHREEGTVPSAVDAEKKSGCVAIVTADKMQIQWIASVSHASEHGCTGALKLVNDREIWTEFVLLAIPSVTCQNVLYVKENVGRQIRMMNYVLVLYMYSDTISLYSQFHCILFLCIK